MKICSSNLIHKGKAFSVEEVQVKLPDQSEKTYDRVNHPDSVTILPLDDKGNIWFVKQFRVGSNDELLELPAGVLEEGEKPIICAKREIREEIGMSARSWQDLGSYYLAPGYCTEMNYAYLAQGLYAAPLARDDDEFLEVQKIKMEEVSRLITVGGIKDSKSLAALGIFLHHFHYKDRA